jgi:hypothetical protein
MAKPERRQPRQKQRLSRKTKKALVSIMGREQYHEAMGAFTQGAATQAKADLFSRVSGGQQMAIRSGRKVRNLAYSNPMSMK